MSPSSLLSLYSCVVKQFYHLPVSAVKIPERFDPLMEKSSSTVTKRQKVGVAFGTFVRKMVSHLKQIDNKGLDFNLTSDHFDVKTYELVDISLDMTTREKVGAASGMVLREIESTKTKMLRHEKQFCETYEKEIDDGGLHFNLTNDCFDEKTCGELAEMVSIRREAEGCKSPMADDRLLSLSRKMICLAQDILTRLGDSYKRKDGWYIVESDDYS